MYCKKFVAECQKNLQYVIDAVGNKSEENKKLEKLLQELVQVCSDDPYFKLSGKAVILARNNNFIDANFCYRVFLQDYKFNNLRGIDIYLKCVLLANGVGNIQYGHEIIFKPVLDLVKNYFINNNDFQSIIDNNISYKDFNFCRLSDKIKLGNYPEFSIKEMLEKNSEYLLWSVVHINSFVLDNKIMIDKRLLKDKLYAKAVSINLVKNAVIEIWDDELQDEVNGELESLRNYTWEQETFDTLTDGQLGDWDDFNGDIDDVKNAMGLD